MVTDVPKKWQSNEGLADIIGRIKMDPRLTDDQKARIARDMKEYRIHSKLLVFKGDIIPKY